MLISDVFGDLRCSRRGSRPALRGPTEKGTLNLGRMDLELLLGILEISDRFPKPLAESQSEKGEQRSLQVITDRLREGPTIPKHSQHGLVSHKSQKM